MAERRMDAPATPAIPADRRVPRSAAPEGRRTNAERRATTRAELFRLGAERFPVKGYTRTTIDDLLQDSGLSRGAFYFHFVSKEQYFLELMRARGAFRGAWWERAASPDFGSLEEVLGEIYGAFNATGAAGAVWVTIIADFARSVQSGEASAEIAASLKESEDVWMGEMRQFVEVLQGRGFARADRPAAELADTIQALMDGYNLNQTIWGRTPDGVLDALRRILAP